MPTYYNQEGKPEIWEACPAGYLTETEYETAHPEKYPPDCYCHWDGSEWIYNSEELNRFRECKCDEVDVLYSQKAEESLLYNGNDWDVDASSQQLILARATYAIMSDNDGTTYPWTGRYQKWRDYNNVDRTFTNASDFLAFSKAVSDHVEGLYSTAVGHKDNLRDEVTYDTYEAINGYDITTGW